MVESVSIFKTPEGEAQFRAAYDTVLALWPVPYEERDVGTQFGTTHLIISGPKEGTPLVLLPGISTGATMWYPSIAHFSQSFRTFAVDIMGDLGKSVPCRMLASRSDGAEWLSEVFDQLEIEQANVMGISYGGTLALNLALAAPNRVSHLVLLAPGIASFGPPTLQWLIRGMPMMLFPSRFTLTWFYRKASVKGYAMNDPVIEQRAIGMKFQRSRIPFRPEFTEEELAKLKIPTLLLIGEKEILYDAKSALSRARQLIPHIEAECIPRASHVLIRDQPELVNARILSFLAV
jgi:pimeloyl-ACP methyl ester carboxylesterase